MSSTSGIIIHDRNTPPDGAGARYRRRRGASPTLGRRGPVEGGGHLLRALVPVLGLSGERPHHHRIEGPADARPHRSGGTGSLVSRIVAVAMWVSASNGTRPVSAS